jgi:hypothetical protein
MAAEVAGAVAELAPIAAGVATAIDPAATELGVRNSGAVARARATGSGSAETSSVAADDIAELAADAGDAAAAAVDERRAGGTAADGDDAGAARRWPTELGLLPARGAAGRAGSRDDREAAAVAARVRALDVSRPGRGSGTVRRRSSSLRATFSSIWRRSRRSCAMTSFSVTRGARRVLRLMARIIREAVRVARARERGGPLDAARRRSTPLDAGDVPMPILTWLDVWCSVMLHP